MAAPSAAPSSDLLGGDTSGLEPYLPPADAITGDASFNRTANLQKYMQQFYQDRPYIHCFMESRFIVNGTGLVPFTEENRKARSISSEPCTPTSFDGPHASILCVLCLHTLATHLSAMITAFPVTNYLFQRQNSTQPLDRWLDSAVFVGNVAETLDKPVFSSLNMNHVLYLAKLQYSCRPPPARG